MDKEATAPHISQKMGTFGHFYSLDSILGSDMITEGLVWGLLCHGQSGPPDGVPQNCSSPSGTPQPACERRDSSWPPGAGSLFSVVKGAWWEIVTQAEIHG